MSQRAFLIHALSPLHPGTGQALGNIDLPIARYRATQIPYLPGSSIKGVMRDALRPAEDTGDAMHLQRAIFGPDIGKKEDAAEHAGAVVFGDARLLALPVRSLRGTFAWVTSPMLLRLACTDMGASEAVCPVPAFPVRERVARVATDSALLEGKHVFFEDMERAATPGDDAVSKWGELLGTALFGAAHATFTERLAIVDDETMTFFWETCTQVDARVRLNESHVVQKGALWYEESLPAETVLVGLASASRPYRYLDAERKVRMTQTADDLLTHCLGDVRSNLQFGGKATVGRGRARVVPLAAGGAP